MNDDDRINPLSADINGRIEWVRTVAELICSGRLMEGGVEALTNGRMELVLVDEGEKDEESDRRATRRYEVSRAGCEIHGSWMIPLGKSREKTKGEQREVIAASSALLLQG